MTLCRSIIKETEVKKVPNKFQESFQFRGIDANCFFQDGYLIFLPAPYEMSKRCEGMN